MKKLINFLKKYNIFLKSINENSLNKKIILIYFYLKTDITRIINKCFFKDRLINDKSLGLTENWYSNNLIYWWLLGKKFNFFKWCINNNLCLWNHKRHCWYYYLISINEEGIVRQ